MCLCLYFLYYFLKISAFLLCSSNYCCILLKNIRAYLQVLNLIVVLIKTFTKMFFHLIDLSLFREQRQEIINLQNISTQDLECLLNINTWLKSAFALHLVRNYITVLFSSLILFTTMVVKKVFCDLHPQFLFKFFILRFVSIKFSHFNIFAFQC